MHPDLLSELFILNRGATLGEDYTPTASATIPASYAAGWTHKDRAGLSGKGRKRVFHDVIPVPQPILSRNQRGLNVASNAGRHLRNHKRLIGRNHLG